MTASEASELTHGQRQIWVGQRLHPKSPLYNMAFAFVFPAELRPEIFVRAWMPGRSVGSDISHDADPRDKRRSAAGSSFAEAISKSQPAEILDLSSGEPDPA